MSSTVLQGAEGVYYKATGLQGAGLMHNRAGYVVFQAYTVMYSITRSAVCAVQDYSITATLVWAVQDDSEHSTAAGEGARGRAQVTTPYLCIVVVCPRSHHVTCALW